MYHFHRLVQNLRVHICTTVDIIDLKNTVSMYLTLNHSYILYYNTFVTNFFIFFSFCLLLPLYFVKMFLSVIVLIWFLSPATFCVLINVSSYRPTTLLRVFYMWSIARRNSVFVSEGQEYYYNGTSCVRHTVYICIFRPALWFFFYS